MKLHENSREIFGRNMPDNFINIKVTLIVVRKTYTNKLNKIQDRQISYFLRQSFSINSWYLS